MYDNTTAIGQVKHIHRRARIVSEMRKMATHCWGVAAGFNNFPPLLVNLQHKILATICRFGLAYHIHVAGSRGE